MKRKDNLVLSNPLYKSVKLAYLGVEILEENTHIEDVKKREKCDDRCEHAPPWKRIENTKPCKYGEDSQNSEPIINPATGTYRVWQNKIEPEKYPRKVEKCPLSEVSVFGGFSILPDCYNSKKEQEDRDGAGNPIRRIGIGNKHIHTD